LSDNIFKGKFHKDHITDGTGTCWCKKRVDITFDGVKVGTGEVDLTGLLIMTIHSDDLAKKMHGDTIKHLSISTQLKE